MDALVRPGHRRLKQCTDLKGTCLEAVERTSAPLTTSRNAAGDIGSGGGGGDGNVRGGSGSATASTPSTSAGASIGAATPDSGTSVAIATIAIARQRHRGGRVAAHGPPSGGNLWSSAVRRAPDGDHVTPVGKIRNQFSCWVPPARENVEVARP